MKNINNIVLISSILAFASTANAQEVTVTNTFQDKTVQNQNNSIMSMLKSIQNQNKKQFETINNTVNNVVSDMDKFKVCADKSMIYSPSNSSADADGCVSIAAIGETKSYFIKTQLPGSIYDPVTYTLKCDPGYAITRLQSVSFGSNSYGSSSVTPYIRDINGYTFYNRKPTSFEIPSTLSYTVNINQYLTYVSGYLRLYPNKIPTNSKLSLPMQFKESATLTNDCRHSDCLKVYSGGALVGRYVLNIYSCTKYK